MSRTICVITGSRSEYGLLRWVMAGIKATPGLRLQTVACGMHLSSTHGLTYREIEDDGFEIDRKIDMGLASDQPDAIARAMGLGMTGFGEALRDLRPDLLLVLGDRFEILPPVAAALVAAIPVAHVHGGESTEGAFDDSLRHAITKMSHLHFVAAEAYRTRVIQLGERPEHVFLVGGLGIDNLHRLRLLSRHELENDLQLTFGRRNLLITFHPATAESASGAEQVEELLAALDTQHDTHFFFTAPNADPGASNIRALIEAYVARVPEARVFTSLGQLRYLSMMREVDAVVGNSSSGLLEAPSLRKPTINIGDRQRGRLRADSVIDCAPDRAAIRRALDRIQTSSFQSRLASMTNPYGDGGASDRICQILSTIPIAGLVKKSFHDLEVNRCL